MEIRAPEQTGQGQTGTHTSIMKILGILFKITKKLSGDGVLMFVGKKNFT